MTKSSNKVNTNVAETIDRNKLYIELAGMGISLDTHTLLMKDEALQELTERLKTVAEKRSALVSAIADNRVVNLDMLQQVLGWTGDNSNKRREAITASLKHIGNKGIGASPDPSWNGTDKLSYACVTDLYPLLDLNRVK